MHRVTLAEGDVLYREGESGTLVYLVLDGEIAMERRGVVVKAGKDTLVGASALVGRPYGSTALGAPRGTSVLAFTRKELKAMIRSDPDHAVKIIDALIALIGTVNEAVERDAAARDGVIEAA